MTTLMEEACQKVAELVEKYQGLDEKSIRSFSEADTRRVFIMPLFQALGWDIYDHDEVAEEVKAGTGRVDYVFKLHGVSQFYLEAKALRVDLTKQEYVKQSITYAYNLGITWAGLSDFEGLQIYNSQTSRSFINLTYDKYISDFDDLWLLSKESFQNNALNEKAEKYGALPPRLGIESRLFNQLRVWRGELYSQVYYHNEKLNLSHSQIDEIIERLFNRLIFIRTCEDRRIEDPILLETLRARKSAKGKNEYVEDLRQVFRQFDGYYDSDLFQHHLVDEVFIETATLEDIVEGLYDLPGGMASYDFSLIDADVLGAVYEQYLGYVANEVKREVENLQRQMDLGIPVKPTIEITAKKQRRKEHGIYYTPKFVTGYIVKETVGRFLQERSYQEAADIRILDPACGSGSFLIRAYDELLNFHARQRNKPSAQLDQWDRLPILTSNIFGVDLDMQAVDIARLNLLLRSLAQRQLLPTLADNIRHGNSLISGTEKELRIYFGKNWRDKKPFAWETEFKDIMNSGGFDIVLGNPPYLGFHGFKDEKSYYRDKYDSCRGRFDLYIPFIEKGIMLLKEGGLLGFICPTNFMKREHGLALRQFLKRDCKIISIVDFQDQQVFQKALNYTGIFIIEKKRATSQHLIKYLSGDIGGEHFFISQSKLKDNGWVFRDEASENIVSKISLQSVTTLGTIAEHISEGIVTGKNDVFTLYKREANRLGLEQEVVRSAIQGRQIQRYYHDMPEKVVIYPYYLHNNATKIIPEGDFKRDYPNAWSYLCSQRRILSGRKYFNESSKLWYELWNQRSLEQQASLKIIVPELAANNRFAYADASIFYLDTACGIVPKDKSLNSYYYLLALLNSSLFEFYFKKTTVPKAGGFFIYKTMFLEPLPIRTINHDNEADKKVYNVLISLVSKMMDLQKQLSPIRNIPYSNREKLLREVGSVDAEIDQKVYELYGITEEEKQTIESYFDK
jgi:type I restriction-modification system DNA methylase subunit